MLKYPKTQIKPVEDILHGQKLVDNYRWLENGSDPKVQKWVQAQNKLTYSILDKEDLPKKFQGELIKYFDVPTFSNPFPYQGLYFWEERQPGEDQAVVYIKKGLEGKPKRLVDPNGMREGNTVTVDFWSPSTNGTYLAYGLSEGGDEMSTLYIKNTETGDQLKDVIPFARYASIKWLPNEKGFFYTKHPKPGTVPKDEEQYHQKVYFHQINTDPEDDELIFGEGRHKYDTYGLSISLDGHYLSISAAQNWNRNDLYLYNIETKEIHIIAEAIDAQFSLFSTEDKFLLHTNFESSHYKILSFPYGKIPESLDDWQEFIPESENIMTYFYVTADKILVSYMVDVSTRVTVFDYSGKEIGKLPLPPYSDLSGIGCRRQEKEFFFSITTFLSPRIIYYFDPTTNEYVLYRESETFLNPDDYEVKQVWFNSKDNTKVPMFIIHKKDIKLDSQNPTILTGYGCHGFSETPEYLRGWLPWLKSGGVFAIANIRGGGEFGEQWHRDGSLAKKQNTFDDFIASAEYLIEQKYTDPIKLGIIGGSNGGLMVGAVFTQRPELFEAVVCRVPVLDMARFHKFLIAGRWIHEFGDPEKADEFKWLMAWSPYHNTKKNTEYPNVLFTTANNDTRVDPLHARKMTALLQATNKKHIVLLRTEFEAGHGAGKPVKKLVETQSYILAFLAQQLKLNVTSRY